MIKVRKCPGLSSRQAYFILSLLVFYVKFRLEATTLLLNVTARLVIRVTQQGILTMLELQLRLILLLSFTLLISIRLTIVNASPHFSNSF